MTITREEAIAKGVLTYKEALEYDPDFWKRRREAGEDLEPTFNVEEGTVNSRFEENPYLIEVDDHGNLTFGRLHKREKPNVNVALIDSKLGLIGINIQMRKAAGGLFAQPVMGFNLNRLTGTNQAENNQAAAIREALEENGITVVRTITPLGRVMVNQTSFTSDTTIFLIDCDSTTVSDQLDFAEGIRKAIWLTQEELLSRIKAGIIDDVRYDNGPLLWTMMKLFAHYPVDWFVKTERWALKQQQAAQRAIDRGIPMAHIHWCHRRSHSDGSCPEGFCYYQPDLKMHFSGPFEIDPASGLVRVGEYACPNCLYD